MLEDALRRWAEESGYRLAWGPVSVLDEIQNQWTTLRATQELDPEFDRDMLSWFHYPEDQPLTTPRSVLVVAVPAAAHEVTFETDRGRIDALLPPTYVNYWRRMRDIRDSLCERIFGEERRLEILPAPFKGLASRLGLVTYGRHNIAIIDGFGSYFQLIGLMTDTELRMPAGWAPAKPILCAECDSCDRCIRACPVGAISGERFLLHGERCVTYHNESAGPLPAELPSSAHHCLIGCMLCQRACPANRGRLRVESTGVALTREETRQFVLSDGSGTTPVPPAIQAKLAPLGLTEDGTLLGRNLGAMLRRRG